MLRRITVAYTVNELGNALGAVALAVAIYDHTHSAVATAALFVSVYFIPAVLATFAVTWLESFARRGIIAALYCAQALTTGGLAVIVRHPILAPILVLAAVDGVAALASRALLRAVVSQRAGSEEVRRRENGYLNIGWAASSALGPAVGGALTGAFGPRVVLLIDVVSFAVTAALMLDVPTPATDAVRGRIVTQLRTVRRYVADTPVLAWLLGTEAVALVFFSAVVPIEVIFIKSTLHASDASYGALLAAWGAGMFAGSGIFARARNVSLWILLTMSTFAVGAAYLGIAVSGAVWVACVFSFVGGTGNGVQWIALITTVQDATPSELQGRLMGIVESMAAFCLAVGFCLGGAVAALSDPRVTFFMAGAAALVATFAFGRLAVLSRRPGLQRAGTSASEPAG